MKCVITIVCGALAVAACSPPNRLYERVAFPLVGTMTCTMRTVHSGVLNPTYYREGSKGSLTLVVSDLDSVAGTATITGNNDGTSVEYRATASQMQFSETTPTGNLTVLTVFAPPGRGAPLPAVYSRHVEVSPANVSISQMAGECVAG